MAKVAALTDSQKLDVILANQESILENQRLLLAQQEDIDSKLANLNDGRDYDVQRNEF